MFHPQGVNARCEFFGFAGDLRLSVRQLPGGGALTEGIVQHGGLALQPGSFGAQGQTEVRPDRVGIEPEMVLIRVRFRGTGDRVFGDHRQVRAEIQAGPEPVAAVHEQAPQDEARPQAEGVEGVKGTLHGRGGLHAVQAVAAAGGPHHTGGTDAQPVHAGYESEDIREGGPLRPVEADRAAGTGCCPDLVVGPDHHSGVRGSETRQSVIGKIISRARVFGQARVGFQAAKAD